MVCPGSGVAKLVFCVSTSTGTSGGIRQGALGCPSVTMCPFWGEAPTVGAFLHCAHFVKNRLFSC